MDIKNSRKVTLDNEDIVKSIKDNDDHVIVDFKNGDCIEISRRILKDIFDKINFKKVGFTKEDK